MGVAVYQPLQMDVASQGQEDLGPLPRGWATGAGLAGSKFLQVPSFPPLLSLIHTIDMAVRCVWAERAWESLGISQNGAGGAREGVLAGGREDHAAEGVPGAWEGKHLLSWDRAKTSWVLISSAAARGSEGHILGPDTIHSGLGGIYSPLELRHLPGKQQRKNIERTGGKNSYTCI